MFTGTVKTQTKRRFSFFVPLSEGCQTNKISIGKKKAHLILPYWLLMSPYNKKLNKTEKFFREHLKDLELGKEKWKLTLECFILQNPKEEVTQEYNVT